MNALVNRDGRSGLTTVGIGPQIRATLFAQAGAASGLECCGLLLGTLKGDAAVVERVRPSPNVHPGDRRRRYRIDSNRVIQALLDARQGGPDLLGFYHSHPDGSIRPSSRDVESAWPGMIYLIVGGEAGEDPRLGAWRFEARTDRFEPLSIPAPHALDWPNRRRLGAQKPGAPCSGPTLAAVDTLPLKP